MTARQVYCGCPPLSGGRGDATAIGDASGGPGGGFAALALATPFIVVLKSAHNKKVEQELNMPEQKQQELPIQPVNSPILCSPYYEPTSHWDYNENGEAMEREWRRPSFYWYRDKNDSQRNQGDLFRQLNERTNELVLVNMLREDIRRWRRAGYETATKVTQQLLAHWNRGDRHRRLFFCQREAVETIIYLNEILGSRNKKLRWNTKLTFEDYQNLRAGKRPKFLADSEYAIISSLLDKPNEEGIPGLSRYCCKMATGSGKTVVMAMLLAWAFCNRGRVPGDDRFPAAALILCPNLTIKERLQVLRTDVPDNYFEQFDIVPSTFLADLKKGKVIVENWHKLAPESEHAESSGGKKASFKVVNKGEESPEAFAKRVLGDLYDSAPIMVLNDEAHHAYRPAPVDESMSPDERKEREEATVWVAGLDRINKACGIKFCVDLTATPFYLHGSGYVEGAPFPWIVTDFGLVDAIESGITKIPRLPVSDTTGRPEPKYFKLWQQIVDNLEPGEKFANGKPKPDVVWREAQDALATLYSQWKERYQYIQNRSSGEENTPPVMIVVCDNTDIAQVFFENISGEKILEVEETVKGKYS